jgi:4a-hydroxytetrahydrobiopterin dehydratase
MNLSNKKCVACEGDVSPLTAAEAHGLLQHLKGWQLHEGHLQRTFQFNDHLETMTFVNAIAWVSFRENHHPDLKVGYQQCQVRYITHAINGLSENDFICAAKIDTLFVL